VFPAVFRLLLVCTLSCLLGACALQPGARSTAADPGEPFATPNGEASYHVLLGELALERSMPELAASQYARAAQLSDDPDIAARASEVAFETGEEEAALASAKRWLELDPDSVDARRMLVSLYVRRGDVKPAYEQLAALLDGFEQPEEGFTALTGLLALEPNGRTAVDAMALLAADHPDVAAGQYALSALALRADDTQLGLEAARKAAELAPEWPEAAMLLARALVTAGQTEAGIAQAASLVDESADPSLRLEYAILLIAVGRDEEAGAELERVLAEIPRNPGALRAAGLLELRRGNLAAAEEHFTALLATGTQTLDAFYFLARTADEQGEQARALRLYSRVRAGDYAVAAQVRAAQLMRELGREEEALEHLESFAQAYPQYAVEIISAQGSLLVDMGKPDEALKLYEDAIAERPDNDQLLYARAFLYEDLNRIDEAVEELRELVRANPKDPTALNALGYTLADHTPHTREAYRYIKKAYELEPDNPAIIDSMGWVEYRLGRYDRALEHLQRAYSLLPDSEIAAHLGEVLWMSGDPKGARDIWEEALVRDPSSKVLGDVVRRFAD
jgi:tetratricopeptide (TPR) repeat protein